MKTTPEDLRPGQWLFGGIEIRSVSPSPSGDRFTVEAGHDPLHPQRFSFYAGQECFATSRAPRNKNRGKMNFLSPAGKKTSEDQG